MLRLGVEGRQISLVPSGVDTEEFSPVYRAPGLWRSLAPEWGDRPIILSVGRLSEEKNIPMIVEAVARLQGRRPTAAPTLAVMGDGPARAEWERKFGALPFVRFLGLQQGRRLSEIYASATMFVFASEIDTIGLVNMEAMASGIPVLVPRTAAFADLVSASHCAECYPASIDGLASAICRVLDDPSHARHLAEAGRRAMVERWSELPFNTFWESQTAPSM